MHWHAEQRALTAQPLTLLGAHSAGERRTEIFRGIPDGDCQALAQSAFPGCLSDVNRCPLGHPKTCN